ncbi:Uncharacterised protein [Mycobacteroides abscessus subsp. abscessus]|nr:Uncharacterised protein [Mycobacteroides abscessus subsp. abscessus]
MTVTPFSISMEDTVLFPLAMPPVNPITNGIFCPFRTRYIFQIPMTISKSPGIKEKRCTQLLWLKMVPIFIPAKTNSELIAATAAAR